MEDIKKAILKWLYEHSHAEFGGGRFITHEEFAKMVKELQQ